MFGARDKRRISGNLFDSMHAIRSYNCTKEKAKTLQFHFYEYMKMITNMAKLFIFL